MDRFSIEIKTNGSHASIRLSGPINQKADLPDVDWKKISSLTVDYEAVDFINSVGIVKVIHWFEFLHTYPNTKVEFEKVPYILVARFNEISGLVPKNTVVKSFYVPYIGPHDKDEKHVLYRLGTEYELKGSGREPVLKHPRVYSDDNRTELMLDVVPDQYFKFLSR